MDKKPGRKPTGKKRDPNAPFEVTPLELIDAQEGPAMKALPSDKHRAYVRALYQVKPGLGAQSKAAKLAGFGTPTSPPASMHSIGYRLAHDERVMAAIEEEDKKRLRTSAPRALHALNALIENPKHKDHARGVAMVLDRVHPAEQIHKVDHQHMHDVTPNARDTAETLKRIAELCAKFNVAGPAPKLAGPTIEGEATLISQRGAQ